MSDCLFCKIVAGQIPAQIVYQDDHTVAFRDINPQAPVHVLVIPKEHIPSVAHLSGEICHHLMEAVNAVAKQEGIAESGYRVVSNVGKDAQQTVPHLHWHVIGGRALQWPPG
ncbi:histidine triad nucleotide-binding protein [bacterium]|nr:histidine triad nucleotide-binding protein [bacterium]